MRNSEKWLGVFVALVAGVVCARSFNFLPPRTFGLTNGAWDSPAMWTSTDPADSNSFPSLPGDHAVFEQGYLPWFAAHLNRLGSNPVTWVGQITAAVSNEMYILSGGGAATLVFTNRPGQHTVIAYTNVAPDGEPLIWIGQNQSCSLDTELGDPDRYVLFLLSNDVDLIAHSLPYMDQDGYWREDDALMIFDGSCIVAGNQRIRKFGAGELLFGILYTSGPSTPLIMITKPFEVYDGWCYATYAAILDSELHLIYNIDCMNYGHDPFFCPLGDLGEGEQYVNVNLVISNGANFVSRFADWSTTRVEGTKAQVTVAEDAYFYVWDHDPGEPPFNVTLKCPVKGYGVLRKVFGGSLTLSGTIEPGYTTGERDYLIFYSYTNSGIVAGTKDEKVTYVVDVDGLEGNSGVDSDGITFQNVSSVNLGNMNLVVNNTGYSNPYRTNMIIFSTDGAIGGAFNSVTWADTNRVGEVVVTPGAVYVTGIPGKPGFFDVDPLRLIYVTGETQKVLRLRSPEVVNVGVTSAPAWVSVASSVSLTGAVEELSVAVPSDVATTSGYGLASGVVRCQSLTDSNQYYDIGVFVIRPGYFELDENELYYFAGLGGYRYVQVYSPLAVTVNVQVVEGDAWLQAGPSQVVLDDSSEYVEVLAQNMGHGAVGRIRFSTVGVPENTHDVVVRFLENGTFFVSPTNVEFVVGETQKTVIASCPWQACVKTSIAPGDSWISTVDELHLAYGAEEVPIVIPATQAEGSVGKVVFVNKNFTNITQEVTVTVVPEGGAVGVMGLLAWLVARKRVGRKKSDEI